MFTVIVNLQVKPEMRQEFLAGIRDNALASLRDEPGCLRFDVHQRSEDPNAFIFHEVYVDEPAFYQAHRAAPHYAAWRQVSERCVVPGTHVNTYATLLFPQNSKNAHPPTTFRNVDR